MGDIATNSAVNTIDQIHRISDRTELLKIIRNCLASTVENFRLIAAAVRRLEECGMELCELEEEIPSLHVFRRIAHGQVAPELFVNVKNETLREAASSLPLPDQIRIANNEPVKVMEPGGSFRNVPAHSLSQREIRQVFTRGKFREDAAQISWIKEHAQPKERVADDRPPLKLDRKRGGIILGGWFISAAELGHVMAELGKRGR